MSTNDNEQDIEDRLSLVIAKHADWLDGRTFQRLALRVARAYFEEDDLDDLATFDDFIKAFEASAKIVTEGLGNV